MNLQYSRGEVVVVPFPFSDLSAAKPRPALVLVDHGGADVVLCQITSQAVHDSIAIGLTIGDFAQGSLHLESNIRPNKLFTFDRSRITSRCGRVTPTKFNQVIERLIAILRSDGMKSA